MKNLKIRIIFLMLFPVLLFSQTPDDPFFPETAPGAHDVIFNSFTLNWMNPTNVTYNEVYLSYDSTLVANLDPSVKVADGSPNTVFNSYSVIDLFKTTRYYWRVVEYNNNGFTAGPVWNFVTTSELHTEIYHIDDFRNGITNWTIYGNKSCQWEISNENKYSFPEPSTGNLLTADNTICGTIINSTAEYQQINLPNNYYHVWMEVNSDWKSFYSNDAAYIEMSTNQGSSWIEVWSKTGESDRNNSLNILLIEDQGSIPSISVRFRTIQNGGESWWAIDNFQIGIWSGVLTPWMPSNLHTNVNNNADEVELTWDQNFGTPCTGIYRKNGVPEDSDEYVLIGALSNGSTGYIDTTVVDSTIYTYKVGCGRMSNEATAYVFSNIPVELTFFTANVSDNNVLLNWQTASELNNKGFEVQRYIANSMSYSWKNIGYVEGNGTTTETTNYNFTDKNVNPGNYLYRLKQIDFDGTIEFHNEIEVSVNSPNELVLHQNYPNPFNPVTTIKYSLPTNSFVSIKVYNSIGEEVAILSNEEKKAGNYKVTFDGNNLPSGIYFIKMDSRNYHNTIKAILIK